jgi:hypothetical protein
VLALQIMICQPMTIIIELGMSSRAMARVCPLTCILSRIGRGQGEGDASPSNLSPRPGIYGIAAEIGRQP